MVVSQESGVAKCDPTHGHDFGLSSIFDGFFFFIRCPEEEVYQVVPGPQGDDVYACQVNL